MIEASSRPSRERGEISPGPSEPFPRRSLRAQGVCMQRTLRRHFIRVASGGTAGMATWLALGKAPAFAQKRELTFLSWNHFVPASDDELRRQAKVFGKQAGVNVRVDTIAHLQLPAK